MGRVVQAYGSYGENRDIGMQCDIGMQAAASVGSVGMSSIFALTALRLHFLQQPGVLGQATKFWRVPQA